MTCPRTSLPAPGCARPQKRSALGSSCARGRGPGDSPWSRTRRRSSSASFPRTRRACTGPECWSFSARPAPRQLRQRPAVNVIPAIAPHIPCRRRCRRRGPLASIPTSRSEQTQRTTPVRPSAMVPPLREGAARTLEQVVVRLEAVRVRVPHRCARRSIRSSAALNHEARVCRTAPLLVPSELLLQSRY